VIIKWLLDKLSPLFQLEGWVVNIFKRIDKLENDSHPPLFSKKKLADIEKRLKDLEVVSFVKKISKHDWQGSD
tara:strand:- start:1088 stop:1306 length:219 start_codon:yes stop_codon:yes gene_type:complete